MKKLIFLSIITTVLLLSSCVSRKKTMYLQETQQDSLQTYNNIDSLYKIKPGDILYIHILSMNKEISDAFNLNSGNANTSYMWNNEASLYINGFSVNDSGYVDLPILGKILVEHKTVNQAQKAVQKKLDEYLKDAIAVVKFISYRFSVLGEVHRPGVYTNYSDKLNIFEALAKAGDINEFGDRRSVILIRPTTTGNITYKFDLTQNDILSSPYYYLKPNDILYVYPLKYKSWRFNTVNVSLFLSSVTTFILVLNFLK